MKSIGYYVARWNAYVKKNLHRYPRVNYLQRVWRHRNDEDFVHRVMHIHHDPDLFRIRSLGSAYPTRNIYLVTLEASAGLGATLRIVLLALRVADRLGLAPVIIFAPATCAYTEPEPIRGTTNAFEYYFEQPTDVSVDMALHGCNVFLYNTAHDLRAEREMCDVSSPHRANYDVDNAYLEILAALFRKYLRLNEETRTRIDRDCRTLFGGSARRLLGVHLRGTDFRQAWVGHPRVVDAKSYIPEIDRAMSHGLFDGIFLATDDAGELDILRHRYGDRLLYYEDTQRGCGNVGVHLAKGERPLNHYLNGLEVLRDMYTLAACDGLICGLSQVSFMTRIIRMSTGTPYALLRVIDHGLYEA